jgi:myo-inositol-1(or 4)-monophosphatase
MPVEPADLEGVSAEMLREIETLAVELSRLAGAEIVNSLGKLLAVRYKGVPEQEQQQWRDPVSEVDSHVEQLIRARLAEKFPGHDILGEESEERPGRGHHFIWAVDPIDGTTNFINGFPAFAASIGVLHRGQPIVGALWCASTHALRAGVYHAHRGGLLHFDDEPLKREHNPDIRRRLAGEPNLAHAPLHPFEVRKTGSAAIECAFVAAGLLRVARFERPNVWDIAGGIALVEAAGGEVLAFDGDDWSAFDGFSAPEADGEPGDIRHWRRPVILGERGAVALVRDMHLKNSRAA